MSMITTIGSIVRGDREVFPRYLYDAYRSTIKRATTLPLIMPLSQANTWAPRASISTGRWPRFRDSRRKDG
jgi:hypothetical protein